MPAPGDLHNDLEHEIHSIILVVVAASLGGPLTRRGVSFTVDHSIAKAAMGFFDPRGCMPDFYLSLNDGRGLILGEIGETRSAKWDGFVADDELPIRVLRIGFDRSVGIMNPRFSRREIYLLKTLQLHLRERTDFRAYVASHCLLSNSAPKWNSPGGKSAP
jgi:hypothetical protein